MKYPDNTTPCGHFIMHTTIAILVIIIIACLTLLFIFWPNPSSKFWVAALSASPFIVSPFNISTCQINSVWNTSFVLRNPHKKEKLFYDHVNASLYHNNYVLASSATDLQPFLLPKKHTDSFYLIFNASSTYMDNWVAKEVEIDITDGEVKFDVIVHASIRVYPGSILEHSYTLKISCLGVKVGFWSYNSVGSMLGGFKPCEVYN